MQTLIALYETEDVARRVESDLKSAGISQTNVRVESGVYEDNNRPQGGLAGFFRWLFGTDMANDSDVYAESLRRGDWAVIVQTENDTMSLEHVEDILYSYNPIDVDARGAYFRSTGWTGYEEGAPVYSDEEMTRDRSEYGSMYTRTYGADLSHGYTLSGDQFGTVYDPNRTADWNDEADEERREAQRDKRDRVRVRTYASERPFNNEVSPTSDTQPSRAD